MTAEDKMDALTVAGRTYRSRLLVGTGKYKDFAQTRAAVDASGAGIVTVAIRRTNIGQNPNEPSLLDALPPSRFTILPNTAGCYNAEDAVRVARMGRAVVAHFKRHRIESLPQCGLHRSGADVGAARNDAHRTSSWPGVGSASLASAAVSSGTWRPM